MGIGAGLSHESWLTVVTKCSKFAVEFV